MNPISRFLLLAAFLWFLWTYGRWFAGVKNGAPFVPIGKRHLKEGMELLQLTKDDIVIDLGSGTGTILREVAKRGARGIGYEFHPFLVAWSRQSLNAYRDQVEIRRGDLFEADLSVATVIIMFGLEAMRPKIEQMIQKTARPGTRVLVFLAPTLSLHVIIKKPWMTIYRV